MNPQPPGYPSHFPARGIPANPGMPMQPVSLEHRQQVLMMAVSAQTAQGSQVLSMTQTSAVILKIDQTNHLLHLLLSVFTFGMWLIVWVIKGNANRVHKYTVFVDEFGIVRYLPPPIDHG